MSSREAAVFQSHYAELCDSIDSPADFAKDFFDKGLIGPSTRDAATEVDNSRLRESKAIQLINAIERFLKQDRGKMREILQVLGSHVTTKRLADVMAREVQGRDKEEEKEEEEEEVDAPLDIN